MLFWIVAAALTAAVVLLIVPPLLRKPEGAAEERAAYDLEVYRDQLGELERGLVAAASMLQPGCRLAVVSFHSLEDRIVKSFIRERSGGKARTSRHAPAALADTPPAGSDVTLRAVTRKAVQPDAGEIAANPRARSARLRVAEKIQGGHA